MKTPSTKNLTKTAEPIEFADAQHAAHNLELFADNTRELYDRKKAVIRSLLGKIKKGVYDAELAKKLWRGWIDAAALMYEKELGEKGDARRVFTDAIRKAVVDEFERSEKYAMDQGDWDYLVDKKASTRQAGGLGLSESAIATHLDVMQDMLAKGDAQGLKKRLDQLAADIKRIASTKQARTDADYTALTQASTVTAATDLRSLAIELYKSVVGKAGTEVAQLIKDAIKKAYELGAAEKAARVAALLKTAGPDADDLVLYIDNTERLYNQKQSIVKNVMRRIKNGTYDAAKAVKLWSYLVEAGAKSWVSELGDEEGDRSVKWNVLFPTAVREQAARDMSETAKQEIDGGEWDWVNEKGDPTRGEPTKTAAQLDPRSAVVYFDLHCEEENIKEDAGNPESPDHELAKKILADKTGKILLDLEANALAQLKKILGTSIGNEGHDNYDNLVCKITSVSTVEDVTKLFDKLHVIGGDDTIDTGVAYFVAQRFTLYPGGVNDPSVPYIDFDDWAEENKTAATKTAAGMVRFPEGVMTEQQWVGTYAESVEEYRESVSSFFDRTKFNRMDGDQQKEYEALLKRKADKPRYRAWRKGGETYFEISKATFEWAKNQGLNKPKTAAGAALPDPSELGAGRLVDLVRSIQVVALGASKSQDPIGTIRQLLTGAGLGAVVEAATKTAASWKALDDKLGKRWILDAKASDVFDAFHVKETKGPGIPLYSLQAIMKDGTTLRYRALKDLKEAQKVAETYLKSANEGASLLLTDGWTRT